MALKIKRMTIGGYVGKDPTTKEVNGNKVASFSVAANSPFDKQDTPATWVNVSVWGKQADFVEKYVTKSTQVYVDGSWSVRQYESNGEMRVSVDLRADNVQIASSPQQKESSTAVADDDLPF